MSHFTNYENYTLVQNLLNSTPIYYMALISVATLGIMYQFSLPNEQKSSGTIFAMSLLFVFSLTANLLALNSFIMIPYKVMTGMIDPSDINSYNNDLVTWQAANIISYISIMILVIYIFTGILLYAKKNYEKQICKTLCLAISPILLGLSGLVVSIRFLQQEDDGVLPVLLLIITGSAGIIPIFVVYSGNIKNFLCRCDQTSIDPA